MTHPRWNQSQCDVLRQVSPSSSPAGGSLSSDPGYGPPSGQHIQAQATGLRDHPGRRRCLNLPRGQGLPAPSQSLGPSARSPPPRAPLTIWPWGALPVLDSHPVSLKPNGPRPVWSSCGQEGAVRGQMQNKPSVGWTERGVPLFLKCPGAEGSSAQTPGAKALPQFAPPPPATSMAFASERPCCRPGPPGPPRDRLEVRMAFKDPAHARRPLSLRLPARLRRQCCTLSDAIKIEKILNQRGPPRCLKYVSTAEILEDKEKVQETAKTHSSLTQSSFLVPFHAYLALRETHL